MNPPNRRCSVVVLGLIAYLVGTGNSKAAELTISCPAVSEMSDTHDRPENSILIAVGLPAKLSGSRIDRAILFLPLAEDSAAGEQIIRVSPAGKPWNRSQATLAHEDLAGVDSLSVTHFYAGRLADHSELDITPIVSEWISGTIENNGLIVSGLEGTGNSIRLLRSVEEFRGDPILLRVWYTKNSEKRW